MFLREPRPRQPFTSLAIAAVVGVAAADRWQLDPLWPLGALAVSGVWLCIRPRTLACAIFTALSFFSLHTLRFHHSASHALAHEFAAGPRVVNATGVVATQPEKPNFWARNLTCFFRLKIESIDLADAQPAEEVMMNVSWAGPIPAYGDRVSLTGSARNLEPARNPGEFDFTGHLQRQGIHSEIRVAFPEDARIESPGHGKPLQEFAYAAQQWIRKQLELDLEESPELTALIESMVLGLRGETPGDTKELFQRTGTLHLFAVSGLNVAMLATIVLTLLKLLRLTGAPAVIITIPILAFYALVTGLSASCVRATIMGALLLLAPVFDRRAVPYNSLAAAAFLILAWDTNQLFSAGFQFSFVLVYTIVFLTRRIQRRIEPFGEPDPFLPRALWSPGQRAQAAGWTFVATALGVTLAAWVGSLAFTAGYFHLFSPAAILANLIAVPIAFVVLALGVATLLTAGPLQAVAVLFNNANWLAAQALLGVVKSCALIPGGHIYVELPRPHSPPACELTVLDVGEGGAIHVRAASHDWLFDCGSTASYERIVLPYLRTRGVNHLDGLLLTHGDSHHLGGAFSVLDDFRPHTIADSVVRDRSHTRTRLHDALAARRFGKALYASGDWLRISDTVAARILFPPAGLHRSTSDDKAIVLQLIAAGRRVLLMSDSGFRTEQWLLANVADLRSDLLIKSQHPRDLSGTTDFLARVQPQAVICGRSEHGRAPLSSADGEQVLEARGVAVFNQEQTGAVGVRVEEGGALEVRAFLGGQTFRRRAR